MFSKKVRFNGKFSSRTTKYNEAKSIRPGGLSFPSKLEAATYDWLSLREKSGEIKIEKIQDHCYLTEARILYIADFKILNLETKEYEWVEAKGLEMPRFIIIKKLWRFYGLGVLTVVKGSYTNLRIDEIIIPKTTQQTSLKI